MDLAKTIEQYFASDLYAELNSRRQEIRDLRDRAAFLGRSRSNDHERICRLASAYRFQRNRRCICALPGCEGPFIKAVPSIV